MPTTTQKASASAYRLSREHDELRTLVRELADERIAPRAADIDAKAEFPWDLKQLLAEHDLLGTAFEERHGGTHLDGIGQAIVVEEVARADATTSLIPIIQKLGALPIMLAGSEEQQDRYFPRLASGEWLPAFALTEAGAGSDVASLRMRARRDGDDYLLTGTKRFITHGSVANLLTVFALTDADAGGRKGMSAFIVETNTPGFSVARLEHKMGIRGSPTAELTFDEVRVPAANRLGEEGDGFKIAMSTLDRSRLAIAAQAVGIAQGAFEEALAYAQQREQFNRKLAEFQAIQFYLADMQTELDAARLLTWKAAWAKDAGKRFTLEAAQAKLFASEMAQRVTNKALQIHGGYGYTKEYNVERYFRDARITEIYEGTSEIQKMVIADWVLNRA